MRSKKLDRLNTTLRITEFSKTKPPATQLVFILIPVKKIVHNPISKSELR